MAQIYCRHYALYCTVLILLSLSVQVFSASVAHAMELMSDPEMTETIRFLVDRFFDCLNVSNLSEGRQGCKPDFYPYQTPNDKRFTVSMYCSC